MLADTLESVYATSDAHHVRVRSFHNVLLGATVLLGAYAVVFGAAQQLFMQFVDKQAKSVLDAATSPGDKAKAS